MNESGESLLARLFGHCPELHSSAIDPQPGRVALSVPSRQASMLIDECSPTHVGVRCAKLENWGYEWGYILTNHRVACIEARVIPSVCATIPPNGVTLSFQRLICRPLFPDRSSPAGQPLWLDRHFFAIRKTKCSRPARHRPKPRESRRPDQDSLLFHGATNPPETRCGRRS